MSYTTTKSVTGYLFMDDKIEELTSKLPKSEAERVTKLFSQVYNAGKSEGFTLASLEEGKINRN